MVPYLGDSPRPSTNQKQCRIKLAFRWSNRQANDLKTEDKLYCAEFIYKAITRATSDPDYIKTTSVVGYRFVGIDDLFLSEHAKTVWQVRYK